MIPARNLQTFENRDQRVTIQSLSTVQDATTGNVDTGWITFATVYAAVEPLTSREFLAAAATQSKVTARIIIDRLAGILPSMRVVHGSHVYKIEGILESANSVRDLTLMCSEIVAG